MWTITDRPRTILVALDGSPTAEEALPFAVSCAVAFAAELVLFRVVPAGTLPLALSTATKRGDGEGEGDRSDDELAAQAYLEALAENVRAKGPAVSVLVKRGPIVATLVEQAAHADLLILANHGAGRLVRIVVGSVAEQVLALCPCPILLIPAAPLRQEDDAPVRSFFDDIARVGPLVQRPLGLRTVGIERIVGSVGRAAELRADFLPRSHPNGDARYRRIKRAMEAGVGMPPVDLYKFGYDYYVLDGHHRLAAAHALGQLEIDAVVTEFIPLNNEDVHRVFSERRQFEQATGLARIGATRPGHYPRLQEMIQRYAEQEHIADLTEAATQWYSRVYVPMATQIRAARLNTSFPGERTADLVVHVEDLRLAEETQRGEPVSWEAALRALVSRYRSSRRHARLRIPDLRALLQR